MSNLISAILFFLAALFFLGSTIVKFNRNEGFTGDFISFILCAAAGTAFLLL